MPKKKAKGREPQEYEAWRVVPGFDSRDLIWGNAEGVGSWAMNEARNHPGAIIHIRALEAPE